MEMRSLGIGWPGLKTSFDFDGDDRDVQFTGQNSNAFLEGLEFSIDAPLAFGKDQKAFPTAE
jgi:hypothetical protein